MSFETLTGGPDSPIPVGINGAPGRIATQAMLQMLDRDDLVPVMANTRQGTLAERWGKGLQVDELYGRTGITELCDVSPSELSITEFRGRGRGTTTNALAFLAPNGEKVSLLGSAETQPDWIHWGMLMRNHEGKGSYVGANSEEVAASMRYLTILDASPLKVDTSGGQRLAPKDRHPGLHLGGRGRLVVATSPFDVDNKRYPKEHRFETVISGVNDDPTNIEAFLAEGVRCFSASSCSTGAIMALLRAVREGGFDVAEIDAFISHSNTESDNGLSAMHVRPSKSGSQKEVIRLLPTIGIQVERSAVAIDVQRVPVDVGSLIRAKIKIPGTVSSSDFIESLKQGVTAAKLERAIGFTEFPVTSATIRNDSHTVMINEDVDSKRRGRSTVVRLNVGFQNEIGYTRGVLDLARNLASTLRGMDEAGEISGK